MAAREIRDDHAYPVAEIFDSVQGEGLRAGFRTYFVRLAGCCVGRPVPGSDEPFEMCTLWDHRQFLCDTDYRVTERLTAADVLKRLQGFGDNTSHVCLTGGEPLIHPVIPLLRQMIRRGYVTSIETSGARPLGDGFPSETLVTLSPKAGCRPDVLRRAGEIKFLVDRDFDESRAEDLLRRVHEKSKVPRNPQVFIQPVNSISDVDIDNLNRCLNILRRHPDWRLSTQMHKVWKVR